MYGSDGGSLVVIVTADGFQFFKSEFLTTVQSCYPLNATHALSPIMQVSMRV